VPVCYGNKLLYVDVVQNKILIVSVCPILGGRVLFKVKFYWLVYILVVRKKILWVKCSSD